MQSQRGHSVDMNIAKQSSPSPYKSTRFGFTDDKEGTSDLEESHNQSGLKHIEHAIGQSTKYNLKMSKSKDQLPTDLKTLESQKKPHFQLESSGSPLRRNLGGPNTSNGKGCKENGSPIYHHNYQSFTTKNSQYFNS